MSDRSWCTVLFKWEELTADVVEKLMEIGVEDLEGGRDVIEPGTNFYVGEVVTEDFLGNLRDLDLSFVMEVGAGGECWHPSLIARERGQDLDKDGEPRVHECASNGDGIPFVGVQVAGSGELTANAHDMAMASKVLAAEQRITASNLAWQNPAPGLFV